MHGLLAFAGLYAGGCGVLSVVGFDHVTQPAAIRAGGQHTQHTVVWLTVLGAFSSPIFLPLTAWLIAQVGWRGSLRVQAALAAAIFLLAAAPRSRPPAERTARAGTRVLDVLTDAWRLGPFRRWSAVSVITGVARIYTNEMVGSANLSLLMAVQQALFALGGALGSLIAGSILQAGGGYAPIVLLPAVALSAAAVILAAERTPTTRDGSTCRSARGPADAGQPPSAMRISGSKR